MWDDLPRTRLQSSPGHDDGMAALPRPASKRGLVGAPAALPEPGLLWLPTRPMSAGPPWLSSPRGDVFYHHRRGTGFPSFRECEALSCRLPALSVPVARMGRAAWVSGCGWWSRDHLESPRSFGVLVAEGSDPEQGLRGWDAARSSSRLGLQVFPPRHPQRPAAGRGRCGCCPWGCTVPV